jgi:hypothetical protein
MGLVYAARKLYAKLPMANQFLKGMHLLLGRLPWQVEWVSTLDNEADEPSRRHVPRFIRLTSTPSQH